MADLSMEHLKLVLESLFLAGALTYRLKNDKNDKLAKITSKAWNRHWRRVKAAKENGYPELEIPIDYA